MKEKIIGFVLTLLDRIRPAQRTKRAKEYLQKEILGYEIGVQFLWKCVLQSINT
jgi:hypothetical protein